MSGDDQPMSDAGIGDCNLLCQEAHSIGRLTKTAAHQPIQIALPGHAHEGWPREGDIERTSVYCQQCAEWYGADTRLLRSKFDELVRDESEHKAEYTFGHRGK